MSDPRQVKEGGSLHNQEQEALAYAADKGYVFVRAFIEPGESAKTDARPVLQEMLAYCKRNRDAVDVLIIPKIDRFARYAEDYYSLKALLFKVGIRIESVGERIDDTPSGRLSEGILAAVAQFDNEIRAERCKGGMVSAAQAGRWVRQAPYGFRNVKLADSRPNIEPCEEEAKFVRRAFELMDKGGLTVTEVHRALADEGMRGTRAHFYRMLRNKVYIGMVCGFGFEVRGAPPLVPIIDEDCFYRVQGKLPESVEPGVTRRKKYSYSLLNPDFPLRGTLLCRCGGRFTGSWCTGKYRKYAYYHCHGCAHVTDGKARVEERFRALLNDHAIPERKLSEMCKSAAAALAERNASAGERRKKAEREMQEAIDMQRSIALKNASGVIPDDIAREEIEKLRIRAAERKGALTQLQKTEKLPVKAFEFAKQWLDHPGEFWNTANLENKRRFQSVVLPAGITYVKSGGFETRRIVLLERINTACSSESKGWWTDETPLETIALLESIFDAFHPL